MATGLRISETLALDRSPFERGVRELEIVGKGGKARTIFLTDRVILWARKLIRLRNDNCPALFVTSTEPPPVPPRAHVPGLPRDLETVILRALHPDPLERYQTVSGMLAALAPILKGRHRMWPENDLIERRADTQSR